MDQIITYISGLVWSTPLIIICIGAGLFFTVASRFSQIRHIKEMFRLMFNGMSEKRGKDATGVSSFQALTMTVAGRVGTGNIAGVATAIALGGPGAIFWMWIIGILGAATSFVECTLAQIYKIKIGNEFRGGPSYYIEKGLKKKWFAYIFAIITVISYGASLLPVQANSIAVSLENAFGFNKIYVGVVLSVLFALVVFGGVKRIGTFASYVVPFMAVGYVLMAIIILVLNITEIPGVFALIFRSAFGAEQAFSGMIGSTIAWGVRRGIYSNEAGEGTAPHAAAASNTCHPAQQGLVQSLSVYLDTLLVCSATAFMILVSSSYNVYNAAGEMIVNNIGNVEMGPLYTQFAVESVFKGFGSAYVAIALFFFAFTSIISGYYYGETSLVYIVGQKKSYLNILRSAIVIGIVYGTMNESSVMWLLSDIGLGAMYWVNIIAIIFMFKPAMKALRDYETQRAEGILEPSFNPEKLGIKNAEYWAEKYK